MKIDLFKIMKYYHLFIIPILTIILSSCSYINDFFSIEDNLTATKKSMKKGTKSLQIDSCPKTRIPYRTSFIQFNNFEAKIKKISSKCQFNYEKNSMQNKKILIINFKIYIVGNTQTEMDVNKLKVFISIVNENNKILTKLMAPIEKKDIKNTKKKQYRIYCTKRF